MANVWSFPHRLPVADRTTAVINLSVFEMYLKVWDTGLECFTDVDFFFFYRKQREIFLGEFTKGLGVWGVVLFLLFVGSCAVLHLY